MNSQTDASLTVVLGSRVPIISVRFSIFNALENQILILQKWQWLFAFNDDLNLGNGWLPREAKLLLDVLTAIC